MLAKFFFKSSLFRSLYSYLRFIFYCIFLKRYKFLHDDNSNNLDEIDLSSLGYNDETNDPPKTYFKKIRDYEKKSLIQSALNYRNILKMFSGNRSMLLINQILSLSYLDKKNLRVLTVGPRTEAEIFCLIASGFNKKNIEAVDLQSYSPLIKVGDLHDLKFADDTFDLIICGWTIAYSYNKNKAANELVRVSKNNCIISVAGTYAENEKGSITIEKLNSYFQKNIKKTFFSLNYLDFPKEISSKHSILTFSIKK